MSQDNDNSFPLPDDGLCQSSSTSSVESHRVTILHCNIRGFVCHSAELAGRLSLLTEKPMLVALNETFLDEAVKDIKLAGYALVSRRDRLSHGGGIALFCLETVFDAITYLENSELFQRS